MKLDPQIDVEYAEDVASELADGLIDILNQLRDNPGDVARLEGLALGALHHWDEYCRPSCGFRGGGCSRNYAECGCPCSHEGLNMHTELNG